LKGKENGKQILFEKEGIGISNCLKEKENMKQILFEREGK
jgi:hypothetical protein